MKKVLFSIILLGLAFPMAAQYTMKLDSVIGADDFDRTRWKEVYTYGDQAKTEIRYQWENNAWIPMLKTEWTYGDTLEEAAVHQWNGETWGDYQRIQHRYLLSGEERLLLETTTEQLKYAGWEGVSHSTFEYDSLLRPVLNVNYRGIDDDGNWMGSSKIASAYNDAGLLDNRIYQTYRNGTWRDSQKDEYVYNAEGVCTELHTSMKGGWGPGANQWREAEKYEFSYADDGRIASELYYSAGWFSPDMALESRTDYTYDANGNLLLKTVSVFNETDWIVRDVYENTFDASVTANKVLGLDKAWETAIGEGLGSLAEVEMPLHNLWTHCVIASQYYDTEFALYCSGFEAVEEQQDITLKAYAAQGCLRIESQEPTDIMVYDLTGRMVAARSMTTTCSFDLTTGLYLVRGGNNVVKVMVR